MAEVATVATGGAVTVSPRAQVRVMKIWGTQVKADKSGLKLQQLMEIDRILVVRIPF